jgi:hypothetical protein
MSVWDNNSNENTREKMQAQRIAAASSYTHKTKKRNERRAPYKN